MDFQDDGWYSTKVEQEYYLVRFFLGNAAEVLSRLPIASVHAVVTSPPYWGFRAYTSEPTTWSDRTTIPLGQEANPRDYIKHLVEILDQVKRVLRPEGCLWLNLGDTYFGKRDENKEELGGSGLYRGTAFEDTDTARAPEEWGVQPKGLTGIPWRAAFAMQRRGWLLRAAFPWVKTSVPPNRFHWPRPALATEYIFMLARSPKTYYDALGATLPARKGPPRLRRDTDWWYESVRGLVTGACGTPVGLVLSTMKDSSEHTAAFPPGLVAPCIRLGTSDRGACGACGAPFKRQTERRPEGRQTVGWTPTCKTRCRTSPPTPCTILDPFGGTGTTAAVAAALGRDAIYIDSSAQYTDLAKRRISKASLWRSCGGGTRTAE